MRTAPLPPACRVCARLPLPDFHHAGSRPCLSHVIALVVSALLLGDMCGVASFLREALSARPLSRTDVGNLFDFAFAKYGSPPPMLEPRFAKVADAVARRVRSAPPEQKQQQQQQQLSVHTPAASLASLSRNAALCVLEFAGPGCFVAASACCAQWFALCRDDAVWSRWWQALTGQPRPPRCLMQQEIRKALLQ